MDPETAPVTVTVETPAEAVPSEAAVADAAERVVVAAETAVALAEGQAAIAGQQAAIVAADAQQAAEAAAEHAEEAAEVAAVLTRTTDERLSWLEREMADLRLSQTQTLDLLTQLTPPPPSLEAETLTTLEVATPEGETISVSTPTDTLDQTVETLTEVSAESGSGEPAAEAEIVEGVPRAGRALRRWI